MTYERHGSGAAAQALLREAEILGRCRQVNPIVNALTGPGSALTYLETNGILDAGVFYALGLIIYFVMRYRSRAAGVDTKMLFTEIPPD